MLRRIDLNLLVTLQALLDEQNVTRAAARLNLSVPALSVQLRQLEHSLGHALFERTRTGRGRYIDISLVDGLQGMLGYFAQLAFFTGKDPEPTGSQHQYLVPYGTFAAADGEVCPVSAFHPPPPFRRPVPCLAPAHPLACPQRRPQCPIPPPSTSSPAACPIPTRR